MGQVQTQPAAPGAQGRPGPAPGGAQALAGAQGGAGEGLQGQGGEHGQTTGEYIIRCLGSQRILVSSVLDLSRSINMHNLIL